LPSSLVSVLLLLLLLTDAAVAVFLIFYVRQRRYVMRGVCLFVCLSVCPLATLRKNY